MIMANLQRKSLLTLIEILDEFRGDHQLGLYKCECGNYKKIVAKEVNRLKTRSCGCLATQQRKTHLKSNYRHGYWKHPLFKVWNSMRQRCENENNQYYCNYGARGISVCHEWHDAKIFIEWSLANGWQKGLQIDRIDNNGNYDTSNCRYITRKENLNNKRSSVFIDYNGERKTLTQWCEIYNLRFSVIRRKMKLGEEYLHLFNNQL